jgi:16S rRNA (guanine966-N2)-methyltransferase
MKLRPTPDAVRERVFAVLGDRVSGARMLDLYAGTGAVGLEALSRGAQSVVFVDAHRSAAGLIANNLTRFELVPPTVRVLVRPAARAIADLARRGEVFDLAWADPPFADWENGLSVVAAAFRQGVIAAYGAACLECPDQARPTHLPDDLQLVRDLAGSASRVWILECQV